METTSLPHILRIQVLGQTDHSVIAFHDNYSMPINITRCCHKDIG